eukprot:4576151-Prymnesium_polylepis.2
MNAREEGCHPGGNEQRALPERFAKRLCVSGIPDVVELPCARSGRRAQHGERDCCGSVQGGQCDAEARV